MDVIEKVIIDRPCPALRISHEYTKQETVYGIVKRVHFFLKHIEKERHRKKLGVKEMKILDVGCGTGIHVTIPLAQAGYAVCGFDMSAPSIEYGRKFAAASGITNIAFYDSFELLRQEGHFHAIICSEVLEHLQEPHILLCKMHELLEDDGILLITVPNGYGYFELESIVWSRFP